MTAKQGKGQTDIYVGMKGYRTEILRGVRTGRNNVKVVLGKPIAYTLGGELRSIPDDPDNLLGQSLRINMGAFGGTAEASMPPYDWAILADLTNDGTVDSVDFAHLSAIFSNEAEQLPGDLDRDANVDLADLLLLTEDWLKTTSWHE